jgi:hypothetical protein
MALAFGCGNKNGTGPATIEAPGTFAVSTYRWFILFLFMLYDKNPLPKQRIPKTPQKTMSILILVKVSIECIKKF